MTRAEAKWAIENLGTLKAMAEGSAEWRHVDSQRWCPLPEDVPVVGPWYVFRAKPEPKLRPWKPADVPIGCIVTLQGNAPFWLAVLAVSTSGVRTVYSELTMDNLFNNYEHSTDGGVTWKKCGVVDTTA